MQKTLTLALAAATLAVAQSRYFSQIHQLTQIGAMTPVYAGADAEFYFQ